MSLSVTLTSKMGSFTFDGPIILSKAKLIRDSITGQYFSPKSDAPKIRVEEDAEVYARNQLGNDIADIRFNVFINPME